MNNMQSSPLSEEVVHLLFNSTLYRSELVMYEKAERYCSKNTVDLDIHYSKNQYIRTKKIRTLEAEIFYYAPSKQEPSPALI